MGKVEVEICLISARGLRRKSSFWKLQWFAVGWINPDNKYCTKIDASGNVNPVWKTKFSATFDDLSESKFQDLALNVEVYSREPFFLRESLLGSATVVLKEFLDKINSESDVPKPVEEVGSFQLRKKNSSKSLGFVDVSIRVSEDREDPASSYLDNNGGINLAAGGYGSLQSFRPHLSLNPSQQPQSSHVMPFPPNYSHHPQVGGANYPATCPLPPPPPSNVGYVHNFLPTTSNYINMPSSVAPAGRGVGPAFGVGVGAGALAGGAVIFGDDFMSNYPPF